MYLTSLANNSLNPLKFNYHVIDPDCCDGALDYPQDMSQVCITFPNHLNTSVLIKKDDLMQLEFFKTCLESNDFVEGRSNQVSCEVCDFNVLKNIIRLVVYKENILDVISSEHLVNPHFLEEFEKVMGFFCPQTFKHIVATVIMDQLAYMPIDLAKEILRHYAQDTEALQVEKEKEKENERFKNVDPQMLFLSDTVKELFTNFAEEGTLRQIRECQKVENEKGKEKEEKVEQIVEKQESIREPLMVCLARKSILNSIYCFEGEDIYDKIMSSFRDYKKEINLIFDYVKNMVNLGLVAHNDLLSEIQKKIIESKQAGLERTATKLGEELEKLEKKYPLIQIPDSRLVMYNYFKMKAMDPRLNDDEFLFQIQYQGAMLSILSEGKEQAQITKEDLLLKNLSLYQQRRAIQHLEHEFDFVKIYAEKSMAILEKYKIQVMEALKTSGADLSRQDLIEHLIGPKNFFLEYYGCIIHSSQEEGLEGLFECSENECKFNLKLNNPTAKDLEEEIRNTILSKKIERGGGRDFLNPKSSNIKLPPCLIVHKEVKLGWEDIMKEHSKLNFKFNY